MNWQFLDKIWRPDTFFLNGKVREVIKKIVPITGLALPPTPYLGHNKYGSVQELRSPFENPKFFKILGFIQFGLVSLGLVWLVWLGWFWVGLVGFSLIWFGWFWLSLVWLNCFDWVCLRKVWFCLV